MAQPRVVTIHYTLTNDQGEQLDSSRVEGREPLSYLEGAQNIIGGLESALAEKETGDQVTVSVAPAEAYGEVNEELIQPVPRSAFEGVDTIEPGMQFQAQTPGGPQIVRVVEVGEERCASSQHRVDRHRSVVRGQAAGQVLRADGHQERRQTAAGALISLSR
mgnify:CR=1 FL=1